MLSKIKIGKYGWYNYKINKKSLKRYYRNMYKNHKNHHKGYKNHALSCYNLKNSNSYCKRHLNQ